MDISLFYFADDSRHDADRYRLLLEGARFADDHGLAAVWTPERHFHSFGGLYPNPSVTAAAIATVTDRVSIRAGSVVAPLHDPVRIAEEWSVVDNLSHGRVGISFASGWHVDDFALAPQAYADRRARTLEVAEQVRRLWRGEAISLPNGLGKQLSVRVFPAPVQPELPVWVTAASEPATFQAAGRLGAGVLTHLWLQDVPELADKIGAYRRALRERPDDDGWSGHVVVMLHCALGADTDQVRDQVREPMLGWLRSSFHLVAATARGQLPGFDPAKVTDSQIDFLVRRSFERYFDAVGLFGTVERVTPLVERLAAAGVDELAALIDFGVPADEVLAGLKHLDQLRDLTSGSAR